MPQATGPQGPGIKWAYVRADGTIVAQSGGIVVDHSAGAGAYLLDFGSVVQGKAVSATNSLLDAPLVHQIAAQPCGGAPLGVACGAHNTANTLLVDTYNSSGVLAEGSFYAVVFG